MTHRSAPVIDTQMIAELSPGLLRFALRTVARREDAEDLVQETWFSALQSVSTFEGRSSLRTWLTSILRRRIADRSRRERVTCTWDEEAYSEIVPSEGESIDARTIASLIRGQLKELTEDERTAITLCDIEDLDRSEAAFRMRVSRGHLRVLLHRGRREIEASLRARALGADAYC